MKTRYKDLIEQTFDFPQEEFQVTEGNLSFHGIDLMRLVKQYGAPLKFTYLPKISENIQKAKGWFEEAFEQHNYTGNYHYCYCTKSSHFKHVIEETLKNDVFIETSSAFDIEIIKRLKQEGKVTDKTEIICNGFKRDQYIQNIASLINGRHQKCIPVIDNYEELELLSDAIEGAFNAGIRIASEEGPKFEFYTSRLGIGYQDILPFYHKKLANHPKASLKMLHFFINTGIHDTSYYWSELNKCLKVYTELKKECPFLTDLNIGGGFPIKTSLAFEYDYAYIISEIVGQVKKACDEAQVEVPNLYTEFGSYTVGEAGGAIYQVLNQKQQNDREKWNMINSSFITTLPDTWAINKRFIMLPLNRWDSSYEEVLLGGLTCDSDDYYNSEQHLNSIYLPAYLDNDPLYLGFFNTGAYQDSIGGFGGIQHCLIPQPKQLLIQKENGELQITVFSEQQSSESMLNILGYSS
ncbi:MAG: arginine decarboxylase [Bacteroidota bacterium]